jgi:hypothetical protein
MVFTSFLFVPFHQECHIQKTGQHVGIMGPTAHQDGSHAHIFCVPETEARVPEQC